MPKRKKIILSLIALVILIGLGIFGWALGTGKLKFFAKQRAEKEVNIQGLNDFNRNLFSLNQAYRRAEGTKKTEILNSIKQVSQARKEAFAKLIETNPQEAILAAFPSNLKKEMPQDIQNNLEKAEDLEGEVEVVNWDDFNHQIVKTDYNLTTTNNQNYSLFFTKEPQLISGSKIKVKGVELDNKVAVSLANEKNLTIISEPKIHFSDKTLAVVLVNFQNDPRQPYTVDKIREVTFSAPYSLKAYFNEVSFGKYNFVGKQRSDGDVFGWYTIPYNNNDTCEPINWTSSVKSKLLTEGIDLNSYDHYVINYYNPITCTGIAGTGGSKGALIFGWYQIACVAHEVGHAFWGHAKGYRCYDANNQTVAISNNCTVVEYGDPFDVMGNGYNWPDPANNPHGPYPYHISNAMKWGAFFLDATKIQDVTTSGTYTLKPIEWLATDGVQALRILYENNPTRPSITKMYYLEYRRPYGFDTFKTTDPVVNGVTIRIAYAGQFPQPNTSYLIDNTPATSGYMGFNDASLTVGQTFNDPIRNITIKTLSVDSEEATVQVTLAPSACIRANPVLTVSPETAPAVPAGTPVNYTVSVKNNDSPECQSSSFDLSAGPLFPGWKVTFNPSGVIVAPGAIGTSTMTVTSPVDALPGGYGITINVVNRANTQYKASFVVGYWIGVSGYYLTLTTNQMSYVRKSTVLSTASLYFNGNPVSGATIDFVLTRPNNTTISKSGVTTSTAGEATWTIRLRPKDPVGTYTLTATAKKDGQVVGSAATTFIVIQ